MIEQGIYFALGCIVTALLAMLFAPVFWRRALRLTRQRLQLQVPLSMQEIIGERDQLRAEFAVERLRIEQAMDRVHASKDADKAEIGRRTNDAAVLTEKLAAQHRMEQAQQSEIDRLLREAAEVEAENGALRVAIHATPSDPDRWRERSDAANAYIGRLKDEIESHRTTIAGLKTRAMGLEMRLTDAERARASGDKAHETILKSRLETAMGHVARHETANISMRRELDDAKTHIRMIEDELRKARSGPPGDTIDRDTAGGMDDGGLRESIHALGLAVAKMSRQAEDPIRRRAKEDGPRPTAIA